MSTDTQFCTFYVGDLFFGIDVLNVQEVILSQEATRIPLAPDVLSGLINLRGQVVTAMDLRRRLGLPERATDQEPMHVILRLDDDTLSFLVDEIGDVVQLDEADFEPPPPTLKGVIRSVVDGVYKLDDALLLVLNAARVADVQLAAEPETLLG